MLTQDEVAVIVRDNSEPPKRGRLLPWKSIEVLPVVSPPRSPLGEVLKELERLEEAGLRRVMRTVSGSPSLERIDASEAVVLCSNDYLGLQRDPRLAEAMTETAALQGAGSGAARLVAGTRPAHRSLEEAVRQFTGARAALTFTSGFAANLAILGSLLGSEDLAVSDRSNHASLIDGLRLTRATRRVVDHGDVAAFREALQDASRFRRVVVVTEGLFSMDGDVAPLADLLVVSREAGAFLVVDDAHGMGVLGPTGGGSLERAGVAPADDVIRVGTFGKAFGAAGAFVAAAGPVVDLVSNRGRAFVFTTSPPPGVAAAAERGLHLASTEGWRRERCLAAADRLAARLRDRGVSVPRVPGPILPVLVEEPGRAVRASERLLSEHGLFVAAIRPPTVPAGTERLRITTSACHDDDLIDRAADAVAEVLS